MSLTLKALRDWRRIACIVAEAARRVTGAREVYIAGGAAAGRLTVSSDIDVVVPLPREPSLEEAAELRARIIEEAEKLGLPAYAPVEIHLVGPQRLERYRPRAPACGGGKPLNPGQPWRQPGGGGESKPLTEPGAER